MAMKTFNPFLEITITNTELLTNPFNTLQITQKYFLFQKNELVLVNTNNL